MSELEGLEDVSTSEAFKVRRASEMSVGMTDLPRICMRSGIDDANPSLLCYDCQKNVGVIIEA